MDIDRLRDAAIELEREVNRAWAAGYVDAGCVLTTEVRRLMRRIKAGQIHEPVQLRYTAGPARMFFETALGECRDLEDAWARFRSILEGWEYSPVFLKLKASREQR